MNRSRLVPTVIGFVVALLAVATLAIGVAYAQQAKAGQRYGQMATGGRGMMPRGPLAMMRVGLGQLELSAEQKQQVRGILQGRAAEFKGLGAQMRNARRAVNSAIANDEGEAAIRAASAELAKVQADVAVLRAGVRKQVFGVLTPEQQATAKELRLKAAKRFDRFRAGRSRIADLPSRSHADVCASGPEPWADVAQGLQTRDQENRVRR
jgi:Spy/CpxP family protein refolding chaperone